MQVPPTFFARQFASVSSYSPDPGIASECAAEALVSLLVFCEDTSRVVTYHRSSGLSETFWL